MNSDNPRPVLDYARPTTRNFIPRDDRLLRTGIALGWLAAAVLVAWSIVAQLMHAH